MEGSQKNSGKINKLLSSDLSEKQRFFAITYFTLLIGIFAFMAYLVKVQNYRQDLMAGNYRVFAGRDGLDRTVAGGKVASSAFAKALQFDGVSTAVSVDNSNSLNPQGEFTVEAWVKFPSNQIKPEGAFGGQNILVKTKAPLLEPDGTPRKNEYTQYRLTLLEDLGDGTRKIGFAISQGAYLTNSFGITSNPISPDRWHHIAGVYRYANVPHPLGGEVYRATLQLFIDGISHVPLGIVGADVLPVDTTGADRLMIGEPGAMWKSDTFFNGLIDEIRISDGVRYTTDFTPSLEPFNKDKKTLALFHFDGDLRDTSGNRNNVVGSGNITYVPSNIELLPPVPTVTQIPQPTAMPLPTSTPVPTVTPMATVSASPTPKGSADLVILDIFPEMTASGQQFSYRVQNQGTADSPDSYSYLYIDGAYKDQDPSRFLYAGAFRVERPDYTFPYIWTCSGESDTVKVCADGPDTINELSENNNCYTETFTCTP